MTQDFGETVLEDVLDNLLDKANGDAMSVGEVIGAFQDRGFGGLITVIGLIASMPVIGGIPGISIVCGILCLLVAVQYVAGANRVWVPSFLSERSVGRDKLEKGVKAVKPYARWVDHFVKPRLQMLVGGPVQRRLIAGLVCVLALTMFPLAVVPWGVTPSALAIVFFGIAIVGRDGVFASIAFVLVAVTGYVMFAFRGMIFTPFF